ncbi:tetratricopeptide repeat protein [Streptomyces sp. NBC_00827]|uniref:tetratricopeptide repeat protein n=1 Tax=Streptomyces sp. NBC_00827 TaxID=2903677 RepID=UPI00386EB4BE|nr:tetratricopeptide repeat protein [Streptomyces sp. NBC_00827]
MEIWNPVGKCSGTGYLVADGLVLTALHNVLGCGALEVKRLGREEEWVAAEVLWPQTAPPDAEPDPQSDGALIRITGPGWQPPSGAEPVRWGRIDSTVVRDERLACVAVGFPRSEVRDGVRDTKEIRGHIETLTGLKSGGLITAYVDQVAVPGKRGEKSRWAGASGAALFARGRLIGVVTTDRRRDYDGDQLTAVSVVSLAARPGFVAAVGELVPEEVTAAAGEGRPRTAYDVEVPPGVNNLPELPSPIFVGRAEVMAQLERALSAESEQAITQTLHGLGGVGKTTLALHYAHDHAGAYRLVWWIRSDTPELIEAGFAALTVRLRGEESSDLTTTQAAEWAVGWLQTHPGWFLVFDNAEKPEDVHAWTGQLRSSGRHLITSRYKRGWVCEPISLRVLDEEAASGLLSRLVEDADADEARALADELGYLPLALEQAGAFIVQTGITIAEYSAMLRLYPQRATAAAPGGSDPERTVARIWRITLDVLEERDPRAVEILRNAAWYAPTGIPRALFEPLAEDPVDLAQLLGLLADYNMITLDRAGVGIHRLVQMVARTPSADDPHRGQARVLAARDRAAELLLDELPDDPRGNVAGWPMWRALLPHVEAILDACDPGEDTADIDLILIRTGLFLQEQGQLSQATDYHVRSLVSAARLFGDDHPDTLTSRNNLAYVYRASGDVVRAIPLYERTLEDRVRVLGEDHPDTLVSRNNLAGAYRASGDVVRAVPLFERTLEDRVRVLGEDHPDTLASRNNLAGAYAASGDVVRAVPLYERTLEACVRVLGEDHPDTLASRNNLAYAYAASGDVVRAVPLHEQTLEACLRVFGEDHPDTLVSRNNLADVYRASGDVVRAIPLVEQALVGLLRVLGENHPTTKTVRENLSIVRAQQP